MYRFNNIVMIPNELGVVLSENGVDTQVYIREPKNTFVEINGVLWGFDGIVEVDGKRGYYRDEADFTIGESDDVHTFSYGINSDPNFPRDIGLSILDSLSYSFEYKFETFSDYITFMREFGYVCSGKDGEDMTEKGEEIIESIKSVTKATNIDYTYNLPAMAWIGNGFGDGDDKLARLGYVPEDTIPYSKCFVVVVDNGEETEREISFSPDDGNSDIFAYFNVGDELIGDHDGYSITEVRWE